MNINSVNKTMVFHFFADDNYKTNIASQIHLNCLKEYAHIFNKIIVVLSVPNTSNKQLLVDAKRDIISVLNDCDNITIKVKMNTPYYEALTFKEEVIDKFDQFDGLVFFGHSKGYSNVLNPKFKIDNILQWIEGMYYLNLNFMDEVVSKFISNGPCCRTFGTFREVSKTASWVEIGEAYAGSFFWLNPAKILDDINVYGDRKNTIQQIVRFSDRGYAEQFCGQLANNVDFYKIQGMAIPIYSHKFVSMGR